MSRKVFYTILYMSLLTIPAYGQQDDGVFSDNVFSEYDKAFDFNEAKDYLNAYRRIVLAEQNLDTDLSEKGLQASSLSDDEFRHPYWNVKKSKAEIAYMLGIYTNMEAISK